MTGTIEITAVFAHLTAADDQNIQIVGGTGIIGDGGSFVCEGGDGGPGQKGGFVQLVGGAASDTGDGGHAILTSGWGGGTSGASGNVQLNARPAVNDGNGGSILASLGAGAGAGVNGNFVITGLPTADPHVDGALWNNAGTLKVSAG